MDTSNEPKARQVLLDVRDRLNRAKSDEKTLLMDLGHLQLVINGLGDALRLLEAKMESREAPESPNAMPSKAKENLDAVIRVLRLNGKGMRRKDISNRAYKDGLISSTKGADGVDAIVGNILARNERLFTNTGWGWWDLAERQKGEQGEPPRFPREKESKIESPKTIH